ncbi:MAG: HEAT repeat domain-containing protein [Aggregatilineales bacterium]
MTNFDDFDEFDELVEELDEEFKIEDDETSIVRQEKPSLQDTIASLKTTTEKRVDKTVLYGLSGVSTSDVATQVQPIWNGLATGIRRKILREMVDLVETDFEIDYRSFALFALADGDPRVRTSAIEALWEDESLELMSLLIGIAQKDAVPEVRAAALSALGRFILLGELGDLPDDETSRAEDAVIAILNNDSNDVSVRRRALEAISNCTHKIVPQAIQEAYTSEDHDMRVSAIFAMGRSADERWEDTILDELDSDDPEMRYEAVRASGELSLVEAVPKIARLLVADDDREIREVAIWSLGETGGKEAMRILELLAETAEDEEDDVLLEAIEDAISNATLMSGDLFSISLDGFDDYDD